MHGITNIIIHCTATSPDQIITMDMITDCHGVRWCNDFFYHYVISQQGDIFSGWDERIKSPFFEDFPDYSLHIAYIGGKSSVTQLPIDTRTRKQKDAILSLIIDICVRHNIQNITGHRDWHSVSCPSFDAAKEYYDYIPYNR